MQRAVEALLWQAQVPMLEGRRLSRVLASKTASVAMRTAEPNVCIGAAHVTFVL